MTSDDDFDFEEFDYEELLKEDDIEKEKEKLERYKEYVEREKKRAVIRRVEYEDRRRDNTAMLHEMTRQLRKTRPEVANLLDQIWDEKDPAKINQIKEKILDFAPLELQNFLKAFFGVR